MPRDAHDGRGRAAALHGEVPVLAGPFIEIAARVKAVRGPLPAARSPPGRAGRWGASAACRRRGRASASPARRGLRGARGRRPRRGRGSISSGTRVLYAHVGLDLGGRPAASRASRRRGARRQPPLPPAGRRCPGSNGGGGRRPAGRCARPRYARLRLGKEGLPMPSIARRHAQTVITTFEVMPGFCDDLLDLLRDAYREVSASSRGSSARRCT